MPVKDSIKKARINNISDVDILEEVRKQNPQATSYFKRKDDLGWSAKQILDDLSEDDNLSARTFLKKLAFSITTIAVFFSLSYIVFLAVRDNGYVFQNEKRVEEYLELEKDITSPQLVTNNKREGDKDVAGKESKGKEEIPKRLSEEEIILITVDENDQFLPFNDSFSLPILMYHHVRDLPSNASKEWRDLTVSPAVFKEQMEYLYQEGYQPINFAQLAQLIDSDRGVDDKHIIISFDDGWLNQYSNAFFVLQEYGFTATFFLVGKYINGLSFISQGQIEEMLESGMEIGSHTMSHPNLNQVSDAHLIYEVSGSKDFLEKMFGIEIVAFAYPYGAVSSRVTASAESAGYRFARSVGSGIDQKLNRLYNLKTLHVTDDIDAFKKLLNK